MSEKLSSPKKKSVAFAALRSSDFYSDVRNYSEGRQYIHLVSRCSYYDRKWRLCACVVKEHIHLSCDSGLFPLLVCFTAILAYIWSHNIVVLQQSWLWKSALCHETGRTFHTTKLSARMMKMESVPFPTAVDPLHKNTANKAERRNLETRDVHVMSFLVSDIREG